MGNCSGYDKEQDKDINLASDSQHNYLESFITNLKEKTLSSLSTPTDQSSKQPNHLIEIVEINHYKRPMIKRSLTTALSDSPNKLISPKNEVPAKRVSRTNLPQTPSKEKRQSFLFKAKEKLKKSKTNSFLKAREESNSKDCLGNFYYSVKVDSSLRKHLYQLIGDHSADCN